MHDVATNRAPWFVTVELHVIGNGAEHGWAVGRHVPGPSEEMLLRAKARGFRTAALVADRTFYGNRLEALVDRWIQCDTQDAGAVDYVIAGLPGHVAAVTSLVDTFVGVAAAAARARDLSGPTPGTPALARDKAAARQALADHGVPDVAWAAVDTHDPALRSPIGYPCIAKPVDGAASWDVELVHDTEQARALARRHAARRYPRGVRPQHRLLFEEYVPGPLFSAEGIVASDGVPHILGWTSRELTEPPYFAELALTFTTEEPLPGVSAYVERVLWALGYDFGPFHLEVILGPRGPRLVELNPRLVGSGAHACLEQVLGVSAVDLVLRHLLDEPLPALGSSGAATQMYLVPERDGLVTCAPAPPNPRTMPGLVAAASSIEIGRTVQAGARSSSDYTGWVITHGTTAADALSTARHVVRTLTAATEVARAAAAADLAVTGG